MHLPGRQDAQPKRRAVGESGQHLDALSGQTPRLRGLSAARPLSRDTSDDGRALRHVFPGQTAPLPETHTARMKKRIDSSEGRRRYRQRFGTVEPVFGNLCYNKGLDRFTLRGRAKVKGQWALYCLVHNIEKLARHGYAQ